MSQLTVYGPGPVVSVPIDVHVVVPCGAYWNSTDLMPLAPGVGLALRVTVPASVFTPPAPVAG